MKRQLPFGYLYSFDCQIIALGNLCMFVNFVNTLMH